MTYKEKIRKVFCGNTYSGYPEDFFEIDEENLLYWSDDWKGEPVRSQWMEIAHEEDVEASDFRANNLPSLYEMAECWDEMEIRHLMFSKSPYEDSETVEWKGRKAIVRRNIVTRDVSLYVLCQYSEERERWEIII